MKILESALNSLLAREETRNRSEVRIFLLTDQPVEDFSNVGTLSLAPGEDGLRSAVIDPKNGFAYFGTYTAPGKVVKVNLTDFTRAAVLPLANGDDNLTAAVIDPAKRPPVFFTSATS